jgi:hypothetical protein
MRYRRPFTPEQLKDAAQRYESFRRNVRLLSRVYAPASAVERGLLRDYRDCVREFGLEVAKGLFGVDVECLNALERRANRVYVEYLHEKVVGGRRS